VTAAARMWVKHMPMLGWVVVQDNKILAAFKTQGAAWRWLDRQDDPKGEEQRRIRTAFTEKYY